MSSPARKYQRYLYCINTITGLLGAALLGLGIYSLTSEGSLALKATQAWVLNTVIAFGAIVFVLSCLGCHGANVARQRIANNDSNWALILYFLIVLVAFVVQVAASGLLFTLSGAITNAKADAWSNSTSHKIENDIVDYIENHPTKWVDIQNHYDCCGYGELTGDLATGSACNFTIGAEPETCRTKLLGESEQQVLSIAIVALVIAFIELLSLISTCCLCCCISRKEELEYNKLTHPTSARQGAYV